MSDIGFWLTKKYAVLQQQADAASRLSGSQAAHVDAETSELPANARASRAQSYGAADAAAGAGAASRAHAALLATNAGLAPGLANAEIAQRGAQAGMLNSETAKNNYVISPAHRELISSVLARTTPGGLAAFGTKVPQPGADLAGGLIPGSVAAPGAVDSHGLMATPSSGQPLHAAPAPVGGGPGASLIDTGSPAAGNGQYPDGWGAYDPQRKTSGYAAGTSHVGGCGMVPAHAGGFSSVGGPIYDNDTGAAQGTPGYAADMNSHAITDRSTGQTVVPGRGMVTVAGSAAGDGNVAPENYKKGTPKVAGKGDGKTDKTLSMLAPGEAVLNAAAAEDLGRDTIDALNAAGAQKMGLSQQPNAPAQVPLSQAKVPGHKGGTSDVRQPGAKAGIPKAGPGNKAPAKAGASAGKGQPAVAKKADAKGAPAGVGGKGDSPAPKKGAPAPKGGASDAPAGVHPAMPSMLAALSRMMGGGGGGTPPALPMGPPSGAPGIPMPQQPLPAPPMARGMM